MKLAEPMFAIRSRSPPSRYVSLPLGDRVKELGASENPNPLVEPRPAGMPLLVSAKLISPKPSDPALKDRLEKLPSDPSKNTSTVPELAVRLPEPVTEPVTSIAAVEPVTSNDSKNTSAETDPQRPIKLAPKTAKTTLMRELNLKFGAFVNTLSKAMRTICSFLQRAVGERRKYAAV